jgi:hypothetical protein
MKLSKALSNLENMLGYSWAEESLGECYPKEFISAFGYSEMQDVPKEMRVSIGNFLGFRKFFYNQLNMLDKLAMTPPPDAKKYGKYAEKWLAAERRTAYSFGAMILSFPLLVAGAFLNPILSIGAGFIAGAGGIGACLCRGKTDVLKIEHEDTRKYVWDLASYYALGKMFTQKGLDPFKSLIPEYDRSMGEVLPLIKEGSSSEIYKSFTMERAQLKKFNAVYPEVIKAIIKSRKSPLPLKSSTLPETIIAMGNLDIQFLKENFDFAIQAQNQINE